MRTVPGVLLFCFLPMAAWAGPPPPACGDHLQQLGGKPAVLQYLGCAQQTDLQDQPYVARYQVAGRQAREIEAFLQARFGMAPLRFICCGWQAPAHFYRAGSGYGYRIDFHSAETLEKHWPRIERFHVEVGLYAEDP